MRAKTKDHVTGEIAGAGDSNEYCSVSSRGTAFCVAKAQAEFLDSYLARQRKAEVFLEQAQRELNLAGLI